jgi:hypothetical protein
MMHRNRYTRVKNPREKIFLSKFLGVHSFGQHLMGGGGHYFCVTAILL